MPPKRRSRSKHHPAGTAIAVDILQTRQQAIPAWRLEQAIAIAAGKDAVAVPPNSDDSPVVRNDRHFRLNDGRAPAPTYPFNQGQRDGAVNLALTADYLRQRRRTRAQPQRRPRLYRRVPSRMRRSRLQPGTAVHNDALDANTNPTQGPGLCLFQDALPMTTTATTAGKPKRTAQQSKAAVCAQILARLDEQDLAPRHMPWVKNLRHRQHAGSGKPYRGVNVWFTAARNYQDHRWVTYNQAKQIHGHVSKGAKSARIVFWHFPEPPAEDQDSDRPTQRRHTMPFMQEHRVFNVTQNETADALTC